MRTSIFCAASLAGLMGLVAEVAVAAENNSSLSPLIQGDVLMLIPDMPNVPPQNAPVMIAQANQAQSGDTTKIRTVGVCSPSPNHNYSAENGLAPLTSAGNYLESFEYRTPPTSATTAILQQPKHGVLRLVTEADRGTLFDSTADPLDPNANLYAYLPDSDYVGNDIATIQVDFGNGLKVNVKYFFQAINRGGVGGDWANTYCGKTGPYWKISSTLDANGTNTIISVEYQSPTTSTKWGANNFPRVISPVLQTMQRHSLFIE
jgi:hypothetical protein